MCQDVRIEYMGMRLPAGLEALRPQALLSLLHALAPFKTVVPVHVAKPSTKQVDQK